MIEKFKIGNIFLQKILNLKSVSFHLDNYDFISYFRKNSFNSKQFTISETEIKMILDPSNIKNLFLLTDCLNVQWCIVRTNNWITIIGPYRCIELSKSKLITLLNKNGISESLLLNFQLYFCSLPLMEKKSITAAAYSFIESLFGNTIDVRTLTIDMKNENPIFEEDTFIKPAKFIERTHDLEAQYMESVTQGNTSEAILTLREIIQRINSRATGEISLMHSKIGASISRTEARLALKRIGVPSPILDAATSEFYKKTMNASSKEEVTRIQFELTEHFCEIAQQFRAFPYSASIRKAIHFINLNLANPLSVQDIANEVGLSPNRLSSNFHAETDSTLTEYIRNLRLEQAVRALSYTTNSIQSICFSVGISDSNYFTKIFRKKYGVTPSDYRKHHLEQ